MKSKVINILLATVLCAGLMTGFTAPVNAMEPVARELLSSAAIINENVSENSVPSNWAQEEVDAAIEAGFVPQHLQSNYTQPISRAEFCALAISLYENGTGKKIINRVKFDDTEDVNVEKAAAIGVVNGVGDNKFDPTAKLTREQAATMLSRLAESLGNPLPKEAAVFNDNNSVSTWAIEAVGEMQFTGIMGGVGNNTFAPKDPYTREQSIMTIMRLYLYIIEQML